MVYIVTLLVLLVWGSLLSSLTVEGFEAQGTWGTRPHSAWLAVEPGFEPSWVGSGVLPVALLACWWVVLRAVL